MTRTRTTIAAVLLASTLLLTGCWGPVQGTDAMVEESDRVLTFAEEVSPRIADELDLVIIEARTRPESGGGMEGGPSNFSFHVEGEFGGELPTQQALEDALTSAGLDDLVTEGHNFAGTDASPWAVAYDAEKTLKVEITWRTGVAEDGLWFRVSSYDKFNISDKAEDEYFPDLVPEFDQSLVTPDAEPVQPRVPGTDS